MVWADRSIIYKLTMHFQGEDQGWSETVYLPDSTPAAALTKANLIQEQRLEILPQSCVIVYAKVAQMRNPRDAQKCSGTYPISGLWGNLDDTVGTGNDDASIDTPNAALQIRFENGAGQWATRYLHGLPDPEVKQYVLLTPVTEATTATATVATSVIDASTVWSTRCAYYLAQLRSSTMMYRKVVGLATSAQQLDTPTRVMVNRVTNHKTGRPFGIARGRAPIR